MADPFLKAMDWLADDVRAMKEFPTRQAVVEVRRLSPHERLLVRKQRLREKRYFVREELRFDASAYSNFLYVREPVKHKGPIPVIIDRPLLVRREPKPARPPLELLPADERPRRDEAKRVELARERRAALLAAEDATTRACSATRRQRWRDRETRRFDAEHGTTVRAAWLIALTLAKIGVWRQTFYAKKMRAAEMREAAARITRCWRSYFTRRLAPRLLALHRKSRGLRRAVRRRRERRALPVIVTFLKGNFLALPRLFSRVRRVQRLVRAFQACTPARVTALALHCRRLETHERRKLASLAAREHQARIIARRRPSRHTLLERRLLKRQKTIDECRRRATSKAPGVMAKCQTRLFSTRDRLKRASTTFCRLDVLEALAKVHDGPSVDEVIARRAALNADDGVLLVSLKDADLERAVHTTLQAKRRAYVDSGPRRPGHLDLARALVVGVPASSQVRKPFLPFTDATLPRAWGDVVSELIVADLRERRASRDLLDALMIQADTLP